MLQTLAQYSALTAIFLGTVNAQDDGNGFIFQCDKPGDFALTFDDGPSQYTGSLLSILSEKGVKATFFVLGTQAAQSDISHFVKQTYDAGHQIASHTYDHLDLSSLSPDQIRKQMVDTETVVKKITGVVPAMMRPPYGNCNERCQTVMKELGYTVVQWNVDSNDWKYMEKPNDYDELVTNILDEINPSNASKDSWISLQHDIHKFSIDRTPRIIDSIKAKGYNFVTLAQCLSNRLPAYKGQAAEKPAVDEQPATTTEAKPTTIEQPTTTTEIKSTTTEQSPTTTEVKSTTTEPPATTSEVESTTTKPPATSITSTEVKPTESTLVITTTKSVSSMAEKTPSSNSTMELSTSTTLSSPTSILTSTELSLSSSSSYSSSSSSSVEEASSSDAVSAATTDIPENSSALATPFNIASLLIVAVGLLQVI